MVQLYDGDGKGKTTAAIGQAIRMVGTRNTAVLVQFMKGEDTSEWNTLIRVPGIRMFHCSRPYPFYGQMSEEEKTAITKEHNKILKEAIVLAKSEGILLQKKDGSFEINVSHAESTPHMPSFMIVLDEITYALNWNLIDKETVYKLLEVAAGTETGLEVVCTGRDPDERLLAIADYRTECVSRRHPYEKGISARCGIEL